MRGPAYFLEAKTLCERPGLPVRGPGSPVAPLLLPKLGQDKEKEKEKEEKEEEKELKMKPESRGRS